MNREQAEKRPAGFGRADPNQNPFIPEPIRVTTEFKGLEAKVQTVKFLWKSPNRLKFVIAIVLQVVGLVVGALMFNYPSQLVAGFSG